MAITLEEKYRRAIAGDALIIATITKAISDKYGEEGLNAIRQELVKVASGAMLHLAKQLGVRIGNGDVSDVAKIGRFVDEVSAVESEYVVESPKRCVVRATSCVAGTQYKRIFPDCCGTVYMGMVGAISSVINPKIKFYPTGKYLPKGDEFCEFICELED